MDVGVAAGARHAIRRSRALTMNRAEGNSAMALVAERIDVRHAQHAGILGTVGRMACQAAFRFDRSVLVDKRPTLIHVALGADHVLIDRRSKVVGLEGAVHVMAVGALDGAFVHRVMEGHTELSSLVAVALEAERGLRSLEQRLRFAAVNAMATNATDAGLGVRRTHEVRVCSRMTGEALGVDILGRSLGGIEDLSHVAAAGHVLAAGAMAVLAGDAIGISVHQRHLGMRVGGEILGHVSVTGGAGIRADELGVTGRRGRRGLSFGSRWRSGQRGCRQKACSQQEHQKHSQSRPFPGSRTIE